MQKYKLIPKITMWVLLALGVLVGLLFAFMGTDGTLTVAGDELGIPAFADGFLFWTYFLLVLVVAVTFGFVGVAFVNNFKTNPKKGITTLCVVGGMILLAVICWFLGSPEKIDIIGYEGTDNQGAWAQLSDMVLYLCYFLAGATILTMIGGLIYTRTIAKK